MCYNEVMVRKNVIIRTLLIVMTFPLFFVVRDTSALTYSTDVGVQFTFNPALQIDLSSADILIPSLSPGTTADSNVIDVIVKTNNITGYTLNATVGNNTTYDTRDLVHEVSGSSANFASINYGASLTSLTTDNTWGYSYSTDGGTNWGAYDGLPLYSDVANIATLKDSATPPATSTGDVVNFKIAAKASTMQASGDYNNVINFIATANPIPTLGPVACESGKICYNANVLDPAEVEGTMGKQEYANGMGNGVTITGGSTATLLASNFSRDGYGFAGWSDTYDYTGNLYGPQEEITTPADMSSGLPLYAIWIQSAGSMQTSDATSACNSLTAATNEHKSLASLTALTDERDGETYTVAKLADGNCWMIENLRLESTADHNSDGTLAQGYGGQFAGLADPEPAWADNLTTANSLYYSGTQDGTATIDIGTNNNPGYRFPRSNHDNTNSRASTPTANTVAMYSYGNYYTWAAAIADTTAYSSGDHNTTSICPKGWKIPLGNTSTGDIEQGASDAANRVTSFSYLDRKMGGTGASQSTAADSLRWRKYPVNFVYSGDVGSGSVYYRGSFGRYWSSTAYSSSSAYYLDLNSSFVSPGTDYYYYKSNGRPVRCVASGA